MQGLLLTVQFNAVERSFPSFDTLLKLAMPSGQLFPKGLHRGEPRYQDVIAELISSERNGTNNFAAAALDQFT